MKQYVVDAFTEKLFSGNPAAVCVMDQWISEELMRQMAMENGLPETAFAVREGEAYHLRWFTPEGEIDLCGHATLACAFVIMNYYDTQTDTVVFTTMSGDLTVTRREGRYEMDFPAYELKRVPVTPEMRKAIGAVPKAAYMGRDLMCLFDDVSVMRELAPDMEKIKNLPGLLLHATAPGQGKYDCISRSFGPKCGIPEDPVCGSGHCHIAPFWSEIYGKKDILAYQDSPRGGVLYCHVEGGRVRLAGYAVLYAVAEVYCSVNCTSSKNEQHHTLSP